jgi:uncharacterized protein (TIGR03067 family)
MNMTLVAALATGLLIAADQPQDSLTGELEALSGAWAVTSSARNNNEAPAERLRDLQLILDHDQFTWKQGDRVLVQGTFQIDPGQRPRTITLTATEGSGLEKTTLGIYERDGDRLQILGTRPGQPRPTSFTTPGDSDQTRVRLRRIQP